jgi:hypothetical protein
MGGWSRIGPIEFVGSLAILGHSIATATVFLVLDGNTSRALRVGLAGGGYLGLLTLGPLALRLSKGEARPLESSRAPNLWWFFLAGAAAGLVSGIVRHDATLPLVLVLIAATALLLGGFHWWALRAWRRVYGKLTG